MLKRRHWIPPLGLLAGHLAHGLAWVILVFIAGDIERGTTFRLIGWVHLVALGWLTLTALSILLHVIPAFTDNQWRAEPVARGAVAVYGIGAAGLIVSFFIDDTRSLPIFGAILAIGLGTYLALAFVTLFLPPPAERMERAIARALGITLIFLTVAAGLGTALTFAVTRAPLAAAFFIPIHANLGLIGWLSLLAAGVSTRTLRVITGNTARLAALHIAAGSAAVIGIIVQSIALGLAIPAFAIAGVVILMIAAALYVAQLVLMLRSAQNPHRPPQAFVAAAGIWLVVAACFGGMTVVADLEYRAVFVFTLLVGWLGQMVIAHLHHIGIRLLATVVRGEDDETQPSELLDARLSWSSFGGFQVAVLFGTIGIVAEKADALRLAGLVGFVAWCLMTANIFAAKERARM